MVECSSRRWLKLKDRLSNMHVVMHKGFKEQSINNMPHEIIRTCSKPLMDCVILVLA